jgi:ABC-2 type transport system permease protein
MEIIMPNWILQVYLMELRKLITYRADFWVNFIGRTFFTLVIAYYLWLAIFEARGVDTLKGFTMNKMVLYYLMVPIIFRMQQGETIGAISREIYDGSLNKYLLYPLNYYQYKITTYLANSTFYLLQMIFLLVVYNLFLYDPTVYQFSIANSIMFLVTMLFACLAYFALNSITEMVAFWADNIWSLGVIIRFFSSFLGGGMIPLAFFPGWAQEALNYTPFPYLISLPVNILLGSVSATAFLQGIGILVFWFLFFMFISNLLWNKGKYKYTGVGI